MEGLANSRADLRLRRIEIKTWGSPVARQYGIESLPALVLYRGEDLVSSDARTVRGKLNSL